MEKNIEEKKGTSKLFRTTLIVDWRNGKFRCLSKKPRSIKPTEILIDFSLKINIPEEPKMKAEGEITLSEIKMAEITVEAL